MKSQRGESIAVNVYRHQLEDEKQQFVEASPLAIYTDVRLARLPPSAILKI